MRTLLSGVGQAYYNVLVLGDLFEFLDLRSRVADPPAPVALPTARAVDLRFDDVTFHYPGTSRMALRNFSLTVKAGEIAAIVGANGAGKSTVLKLACRFYDPQGGRVCIGSIDARDVAVAGVRGAITALFQQSLHYGATVAGNIDPSGQASRQALEAAVRAAGAEALVDRLPQGYATVLGRWFPEGIELSAGEWQRLALARAFMRASPIVLLDEPTSAMDPWAETEWMSRFRASAQGRAALIVTHRFTTAMQADVIHVMHEGRIVESGRHADLLATGSRYARSWEEQLRAPRAPAARRN
jgi:ATP-binding cassette subfamily B protein